MAVSQTQGRRNYVGLAWHGTFLAAATALGQPTTILPAYVVLLGGSPLVVGAMVSVLLAGSVVPELFFAHVVEGSPRKRPYLLFAVFSRAGAWLVLGALTWLFADSTGAWLLLILFALLTVFSVGGSLGSVAYTDIFGRSIPPGVRNRFYASRQFLGSIAALAVTYVAQLWLTGADSTTGFALLFLGAGLLMLLAGIGFLMVQETPVPRRPTPPLADYLRQVPALWRRDPGLRRLVLIENVASLHLMLLPFYALLAEVSWHASAARIAFYTMAQIVGGALSNVFWGWLGDRFGSTAVLRVCLWLGAGMPLLGLALAAFAPGAYFIVFVFLGAAISSRNIAYNNVLVDLAPAALRATYTGIVGTLTAPTLFLPLIGGSLIAWLGYPGVFIVVAVSLGLAAVTLGRRLAGPLPAERCAD